MKPKTIIITDASSGIEKAAATQIAQQGHRVVLACRNPEKVKTIENNMIIAPLDLARRASIHAFTDWAHRELDGIDVLINNATDFDRSRTERTMTPDGFETTWFTHHLAPVLLVDRLMDMLVSSPQGRVLQISSKGLLLRPLQTVNLKDPMFINRPYSAPKAFHQSKLAQIMYTLWLAKQLTGTMVTANCIRVSPIRLDREDVLDLALWPKRINAIKSLFSITPEQMAETYTMVALDDALKNLSGKQFEYPLKETSLPIYAKDPLCIEQVMQLTYNQLGIQPAISFEEAGGFVV